MGQLKITMAQFFRVNGGSTQNRGVVPDIRFPSAGDPQEYGERSLDNALPWTSIDAARYDPSGDLSRLVAVADSLYQKRVVDDQEFGWLLSDIDDFNEHASETRVSLLESVGRQKLKEEEDEREKRKALRSSEDPLLSDDDVLADTVDPDLGEYPDMQEEEDSEADEDEDQGPDLLLREAARIVADMSELQSDMGLLEQHFAQLSDQAPKDTQLN
jgi:carboxyl-terminal processing protease